MFPKKSKKSKSHSFVIGKNKKHFFPFIIKSSLAIWKKINTSKNYLGKLFSHFLI